MNCPRCQGLLIGDQIYNKGDALYVLSIWRCLNCGETFDSLTIRNRTSQKGKEASQQSKTFRWADVGKALMNPS
jgi:hypothetical protein